MFSQMHQVRYTTVQKFDVGLFCSSRLHLFDQKCSKSVILCNIIAILKWLFFYFNKVSFIPVIKASLLQSSVSHDPSEIIKIWWFAAQETFLININVENNCDASYFW